MQRRFRLIVPSGLFAFILRDPHPPQCEPRTAQVAFRLRSRTAPNSTVQYSTVQGGNDTSRVPPAPAAARRGKAEFCRPGSASHEGFVFVVRCPSARAPHGFFISACSSDFFLETHLGCHASEAWPISFPANLARFGKVPSNLSHLGTYGLCSVTRQSKARTI
jgi:hypothetical protein